MQQGLFVNPNNLSESNRKTFANILGLEEWLLDDLHIIILVALSCGLEIDSMKFQVGILQQFGYQICKKI